MQTTLQDYTAAEYRRVSLVWLEAAADAEAEGNVESAQTRLQLAQNYEQTALSMEQIDREAKVYMARVRAESAAIQARRLGLLY